MVKSNLYAEIDEMCNSNKVLVDVDMDGMRNETERNVIATDDECAIGGPTEKHDSSTENEMGDSTEKPQLEIDEENEVSSSTEKLQQATNDEDETDSPTEKPQPATDNKDEIGSLTKKPRTATDDEDEVDDPTKKNNNDKSSTTVYDNNVDNSLTNGEGNRTLNGNKAPTAAEKWQAMYSELVDYRVDHGDCLVVSLMFYYATCKIPPSYLCKYLCVF